MTGDSRKEMELALARQFGFPDYESLREGIVASVGKAGLRRLEKELDKYGPPAPASPPPEG